MIEEVDHSEPRQYLLALDHHPELAREVGLILSAFAILELMPMRLLAKITGVSVGDAEVLSSQFRSFGSRIMMLEALIKTKDQHSPEIKLAIEIVSRLKTCSAIRNKYAHGLWSQILRDNTSAVRIINWLPDSRKSIATIVNEQSIREDCATLRETLHYSINYSNITVPDLDLQ